LIILAFEDSVNEGDGERLYDIYKLALLLYKSNNHFKYAYVTLLNLVKICAILPEFEAERLKWNRFVNNQGKKGSNIPLDLKKEHQNRVLSPNLNEKNAARLAGTVDVMEQTLQNVDKDCKLLSRSSHRCDTKKEEVVHQIVEDIVSIQGASII
jgi:hypothetical protein